MKQFISQNDNAILQKTLNFYTTQEVDEFIKEKIEERDFAMTLTEMNKEYELFGSDFEILLVSIMYKMPIIIFQNDSKGLLMATNTESLHSIYELGDPPARVHPDLVLVPLFLLLSNESILPK